MRIAIFYNLPSGGGKRSLFEWVRRLAKKHYIDVYTYSGADHSFCDIRPFVHQYRIFDFSPRRLYRSPLGRLNQLQRWRDLASLEEIGGRVAETINAGAYDVVLAQPCIFTYIPIFIHALRIPASYYLHEPFGRNYQIQFERPYLKNNPWRSCLDRFDPLIRLYNNRLEQVRVRNINSLTQLLANSQFTQTCMWREYQVHSEVCHIGVNSQAFHPLPTVRKENVLLSVGQLTPRKGFDFLVESVAKIPADKRPELRLVSNVSNSPQDLLIHEMEKRYLCAMADRLGVELRILTNLDTEHLMVEYNRARLCVYSPVREPFGLVPLEAMACGTPVVGVREGGVQESILHEQTGLLVERDAAKFAQAVLMLWEDPQRLERYGKQAREYVQESWSWERSVEMLEAYLVKCQNGIRSI